MYYPPVSLTATVSDISCYGQTDGYINLHVIGGASPYTYLWSNGLISEDIYNLSFGPISCVVTDNNGCQSSWVGFIGVSLVSGCTDSTAFNFDPTANVDDSSCVYTGCLDINATNYNPNATISDSSCIYPPALSLQGVMDFSLSSSNGKAVHLQATDSISDLSVYSIRVASNGSSTFSSSV